MSERSLKSRVLSNRAAVEIIEQMIHLWSADNTLGIANAAGVAAVDIGHAMVNIFGLPVQWPTNDTSQWRDTTVDDFPEVRLDEEVEHAVEVQETEDKTGLGRSQLLTLFDADGVAEKAANECIAKLGILLRAQIAGQRSGWKQWVTMLRAERRMAFYLTQARQKMLAACYRQRGKRTGIQCVSTSRRRDTMPEFGFFIFGGATALHAPRGRPALPAAEWLRRYRARRRKERKTNRTRTVKNPITKAPTTKHGRPSYIFDLKCKHLRPVSVDSPAEPVSVEDVYDPEQVNVQAVFDSFPAWIQEQLNLSK